MALGNRGTIYLGNIKQQLLRFHQYFHEMSEIQFPFQGKSDILALIAFSTTMLLSESQKAIFKEECHFGYLIYYSRP